MQIGNVRETWNWECVGIARVRGCVKDGFFCCCEKYKEREEETHAEVIWDVIMRIWTTCAVPRFDWFAPTRTVIVALWILDSLCAFWLVIKYIYIYMISVIYKIK